MKQDTVIVPGWTEQARRDGDRRIILGFGYEQGGAIGDPN
jgi:hypothetical protein